MWLSFQWDPTNLHTARQHSGWIGVTIRGLNFKDLAYLKNLLKVLLKKRHIHEVNSDSRLLIRPICLCLHRLGSIVSRLLTANARLHKWLVEGLGLIFHEKLAVFAILSLQLYHFTVLVLLLLRSPFKISCQLRLTRGLYVILAFKSWDYSVERSRFVGMRLGLLFSFGGLGLILLASILSGCTSSLLERILL